MTSLDKTSILPCRMAALWAAAVVFTALAAAGSASASAAPRPALSASGPGLGSVSDVALGWSTDGGRRTPGALGLGDRVLQGAPHRTRLSPWVASSAARDGGGDTVRGHGFARDARGFVRIDVPGARFTAVAASNSGGRIVGDYLDARKRFHGFLREGRRVRTIDFPGAEGTFAAAIDDRGRVVGSYTDERDTPAIRSADHGYLLDGRGRFRNIDVPGATATRPAAISNRGQIAGEYVDGKPDALRAADHPAGAQVGGEFPAQRTTRLHVQVR